MSRRDLYWTLGLTILFEAVTCFFRFGLQLQSTQNTGFLRHFTFGLRIHHGYVGVLLVIAACWVPPGPWSQRWLFRIGFALIASDLIHHFLVLWPITGEPRFDLTYPD